MDSIQLLDLSLDNQSVYFFHLPKYDQEGASVRYTIREIFVDADGNEITPIQLAKNYPAVYLASQEYSVTYQAGDYEVTPDHTRDTQTIQVVNQLSDTKTVTWYCLWKDAYVYESGERPDIYLDIYRQVHYLDENDQVATRVELVMPRYKWVYDDISPDSDKKSFWVAQMEGLQKYDDLGYEITYYAVESTSVDYTQFNYLPPQYSSGKDTTGEHIFGSVQNAGTGGNDVCDVTALAGETSYALREGCTFVNLISGSIVFEGGKVWQNLPEDYPHEDLPRIRLSLDRSVAGDTSGTLEQDVAWLEISSDQWEDLWDNGVYSFRLEYLGQNFLSKQDGTLTVTGGADAQPLPRFDSEGRLYQYTLGEEILLGNTSAGNAGEDLFDTTVAGSTVTNRFDSPKGAISVKKLLTVPTNLEQYPAITFQLTRTYTKNDGTTSQPEIYMTEMWDAEDVKASVEAQAGTSATVTVEHIFTFSDLPTYAPNGSEYVYSVREVKTNLGGYDTWAGIGDLTSQQLETGAQSTQVGGLKPQNDEGIDATFLNKFTETREEVDLTGTKTWTDYSNYFGFRPDDLTLTLERMAPAQPYQDNQIDWQTVTVQADDIQWVKTDNTWTYTITGLERYAPNGMAWQYRVTESQPDKYTSSPASGTVLQKGTDAYGNITMVNLTNTLQASAAFRKNWVDSDGSTITENYLGTDVTLRVNFQLQVRAAGSSADGWTDAEDYFRANLTQAAYETLFTNYSFTQSITGAIDKVSAWNSTQYFRNLPTYIEDVTAQSVQLQYRVVETSIEVLQEGQTAYTQTLRVVNDSADQFHYETSGLFTPWYGSQSATSRPNGNTIHYNQLTTTDLTVEKVWDGDSDNDYGTRPEANRTGYEWRTSLVIQRRLDGGQWENLTDGDGQVCVVTLYGKEGQDSASTTVTDLPNYLISNGQLIPCQYRAAELPAGWTDGDDTDQWLEDGQSYNGSYTVAYSQNGTTLTVTNTMDTTQVRADKQWFADPGNVPTNIILELKYLGEDGTTWKPFSPTARVVLNGQADPNPSLPYYEVAPDDATNWNALWTNVPLVMPGSQLDNQGHTQYKVFEVTVPSGFQMTQNSDTSITNTQTITLSVQKYWSGVAPADLPDSVTVTLLQNGTAVDAVELTEANGWHASFSPQPKYDSAGELYTYTVSETLIDGADPANTDFLISYGGSVADGFEVYNVESVDITVTKAWKDNSDAYDTRPEELELVLERTTKAQPGENDWEVVNVAQPEWTKSGNQWALTYENLPKATAGANPQTYTYRVRETTPADYVCTVGGQGSYSLTLTNTLTGTTELPVTKTWLDGNDADGLRPDSIQLELLANGTPTGQTLTLTAPVLGGNQWSGKFTNLAKYDSDGALITYTVREVSEPEDYNQTGNDGANVTNTQTVTPTVQKYWSGVAPEDLPDSVTVTLLQNGTAVDTVELTATNGWSASFDEQLKYDAQGNAYTYTVAETLIDGADPANTDFLISYGGSLADGFEVYNVEPVDISVTKVWKDNSDAYDTRPEELALVLERTTKTQPSESDWEVVDVAQPGWAKSGDQWTLTYEDLPKATAGANPLTYTYRVRETTPADYVCTVGGQGSYNLTLTNTLTGTTELPVTKTWLDGDDADGLRPDSIQLELLANGTPTGQTLTLTAPLLGGSQWSGKFTNLAKYDAEGALITYTVREVSEPEDYNQTGNDGANVTNTQAVTPSVQKYWSGVASEDLPDSVTVTLLQNGTAVDTVELTEANGWSASFQEQLKYDAQGNAYTYTVEETLIGNAEAADTDFLISYGGSLADGFEVYNVEPVDITVTKVWKDNSDAYDTRPEELELVLERTTMAVPKPEDWEVVDMAQPQWTKSGDQWTLTYEDLPKATAGANPLTYTYRVREITPTDYVSQAERTGIYAFQFTNTLSRTLDVPVIKIWVDNDNALNMRPADIQVELLANGEPTGQMLTLTAQNLLTADGNGWLAQFTGLPEFDDQGVRIVYTVREVTVPQGYQASVDGMVVTNTGPGNLVIEKRVEGTAGETQRQFHFTLTLSDTTIDGVYGDLEFSNGVATFQLKDGQSVRVEGLPQGITYQVTEDEADQQGYTTTARGATGTIRTGETQQVQFVNTRNDSAKTDNSPKTGDSARPWLYVGLLTTSALVLTGVGVMSYRRRRK